jgi:hypothetical protein
VKHGSRSWWLWLALVFLAVLIGAAVFLQQRQTSAMESSLDKLAAVSLSERWSHPEMLKIRKLGLKAIPALRRVLREKDAPSTRLLLWLKLKWPGISRICSFVPDPNKLSQRRWAACQVIQTLGPAGKAAVPELVAVLASKDGLDVNAGTMALWAVGIDADVCERLDQVLEKGPPGPGGPAIIMALGHLKPPSERTLKVLTAALTYPAPPVPTYAAEALGRLGAARPSVISGLKQLMSASTDGLTAITASAALWELEKDSQSITGRVFSILQSQLLLPLTPVFGGGSGGQGIDATEETFIKGAALLSQMKLEETDRASALAIFKSFCEKSQRIFIRMHLLPAMMKLGLPREQCLEVCNTGLWQQEVYYRIQAAQLLVEVGNKYPLDGIDLDALIRDKEVGVRVYSAIAHWRQHKRAAVLLPVLIEALDRDKHQSYYYAQILPAALKGLAEIGPEARDAFAPVTLLTHDPNPAIAELASETLAKIR